MIDAGSQVLKVEQIKTQERGETTLKNTNGGKKVNLVHLYGNTLNFRL